MNIRRKVIAASAAMLFTSTVGLGGLAIGITYLPAGIGQC